MQRIAEKIPKIKRVTELGTSYWEKVRGMWRTKRINGLAYQRRVRSQSDQRLKR